VRRHGRSAKPTSPGRCARRWGYWVAKARRVNSMRFHSMRFHSMLLHSVRPLPTLGAGAACSPAAATKMAVSSMAPPRVAVPQPPAPAWARHGASHAQATTPLPGPTPGPGLPRYGNRRRCCSIAPSRESRDCDARRCCRACPRDVPHNFPDPRRRYRRMSSTTGNTTQRCKSSARRAMLSLQSRQQGYETHGAERLAFDPRLTLGVTIELLAAVRPHRRD
jgi:hypothetical protein